MSEMKNSLRVRTVIMSAALAAMTSAGYAQVWNGPSGGNWDTPTNWTPNNVPDAVGAVATINTVTAPGAQVISASAPSTFTVGRLDFGTNAFAANAINLTLSNAVGLVFDVSTANAQLNLFTGISGSSTRIDSAIQLNDNLTSTVTRNGGNFIAPVLAGPVNLQGNTWTFGSMNQDLQFTGLISGTNGALAFTSDHGSMRVTQFLNTASTFNGGVSIGRNNRLVLGGNNTSFTGTGGGGVLGTGTITAAANSTTNDGGAATLQSNGVFDDTNSSTINLLTNTVSIPTGRVLRIEANRPLNLGDAAGDLTGAGRLVKVSGAGNGTRPLILNFANTGFTGTAEIQDGQLQTRATNALAADSTILFNPQNGTNGVGLHGPSASGASVVIGSTLNFQRTASGNAQFINTSGGSTFELSGNFANSGTGTAGYIGVGRGNGVSSNVGGGFGAGVNSGTATIVLSGTGSLENNLGIVDATATQSVLRLANTGGTQTFSGVVSGNGDLVRNGAGGTTVLSNAANTYSGTTTVTAGTLLVNGAHSGTGAYTVNGGILGGNGSIAAATTISSGTLAPGANAGTLAFGGLLSLASDALLSYELNAADQTAGAMINDLTTVGGNLVLDGTLNVASASPLGEGTWRLFNYTGALTNNILNIGTISLAEFGTASIDTSNPGQVNLVVVAVPEPTSFAALALGGIALLRRRRSN